jgi:hypothetical protein
VRSSSSIIESLATLTYGNYEQVTSYKNSDFTQLDPSIFSTIKNSRQTYALQYRSTEGTSGSHVISIFLDNQRQKTQSNSSEYTVSILAPEITLSTPTEGSIIERTALMKSEKTFLYDIDTQTVQFQLGWPDGYPRSIASADLLIQNQIGTEAAASITPSDMGTLSFEWDMRGITTEGDNPIVLQVRVTDELGYTASSQPVSIIVRNTIPTGMASSLADAFTRYVLIGLSVLVLGLIFVVIFFWKKVSKMATGRVVGKIFNDIKKTITGGGKKGKPLAILKVVKGPADLVGKELPIYTESTSLGRDPSRADFTFYSDSNSSISGLHAKLERVNNQWRIVGVSQSGSETFIDDVAIPSMEPRKLIDGQIIRLGYPAQQCVELEFRSVGSEGTDRPNRRTRVEDGPREKAGPTRTTEVAQTDEDEDEIGVPIIGKDQPNRSGDDGNFDDFFHSLRDE